MLNHTPPNSPLMSQTFYSLVLVDGAGNITEGPGFNVFALKEGGVTTPNVGVLEGITRLTALELLAELDVPAAPGPLSIDALKAAEEVFVTSTAGGVMPVGRIDGAPVGEGAPGELTRRLTDLYWEKHTDPAWSVAVSDLPGPG